LNQIVCYQTSGFAEPVTVENVVKFLRNEPRGLLRVLGLLRLEICSLAIKEVPA